MNFTQIGATQRGRARVHANLSALEVMPEGKPHFQAQTAIPLLEEKIEPVIRGRSSG